MKRIAFVIVFGLNLGATVLFADSGQDAEMAAQKVGGGAASAPVGSADKISFTGAFTYGYPIEIPPGVAGVQPNLSLNYNSGAGNSWVGVGWDLSLGCIQRSTKNGIPTYTDSDVFTYVGGGATMELVSADGGVVNYRPRIEGTFQRFVRENGGWTVYDKSGMKLVFGQTANGRTGPSTSQTYQWMLEKVIDRNGNWYSVSYGRDGGQLYPDTILYTGNDATGKTHRRVHLTVETRPDTSMTLRPGYFVSFNVRLVSIETFINPTGAAAGPWTPVRTYTLKYGTRQNGVRSELKSIQVSGTDGTNTITLPSHSFGYQSTPSGAPFWSIQSSDSGYQLPNFITYNPRDNGMRFAELNGDGKIDLVRFYSLNGTPQADTWLNNGRGFTPTSSWHLPVPVTVEGNGTWWDGGVRLVDLNGDGLTDVLRGLNYHQNTPTMEAWINTGTDFVSSSTWAIPDPKYCFTVTGVTNGVEWFRDNGVYLVDVNGDGLPDLVQSLSIDGTGVAQSVRLNTGHGWAAADSPNWVIPAFTTLVAHDGRTCVPNGVEFVDLNGDGLVDIIQNIRELSTLTDSCHRWLNTGSGWMETAAWDNFPYLMYRDSTKPLDNGVRFADMNGDGLPDLVQSLWQTSPVSLDWRNVRLNLGTSWGPPIGWNFPEVFAQNDLDARNGLNTGTVLIDINGDGRPDMVRSFGQPGGQAKSVALGLANSELMNHVTTPAGGTVDATYGVASAEGTHQIPFPVTYLKSLTLGDGRGGAIPETYSYQGGLFDPAEREFLGFARVDSTDAAGVVTSSYFNQITSDTNGRMSGNPLKGRMYRQDVSNGGALLHRVDTEWEAPVLAPAARFARVKSVTETMYDGPAPQSMRTRLVYDDAASPRRGNVLQTISDGDPGLSGDERTEDTEFATPTSGASTTAFPKRERLLGPAGETLSETQLLYDGLPYGQVSKGNVTTVRRWLDKPAPGKWIETYAVYNSSGQVTRATDARGASAGTSYDDFGFPASSTNRKGQATATTYDPRYGNLLSSVDPNGVTTRAVYDALGRHTADIGSDDSATYPTVSTSYHDEYLGLPSNQLIGTEVRNVSNQPGTQWSQAYFDGLGRTYKTLSENQGDSAVAEVQYDSRGLMTATSIPRFRASGANPLWVTTTYDALRRPRRVMQPDGTYVETIYSGRHTDVRDALGRVQGMDVDAYGRIVQRTEPSVSAPTEYSYDAADRLRSVTNARGQVTSMTYDSLGRKLSMSDPNAGAWSYSYDDNGNLISQTDPRGVKIAFTYDPLDRLLVRTLASDSNSVTGSPVGTALASFAYDETTGRPYSIGQLTSAAGPSASIAYYHDRMGRVNREVHSVDGTNYDVRTAYDAAGRPTSLTYPSDGRIAFTYGDSGLPTTIVNESSATLASFGGYDALYRATQVTLGGGKTQVTSTYDPKTSLLSRAQSISYATGAAVPFRDVSYAYDAARNITGLTDNLSADRSQTFSYDPLNRLTAAQGAYGSEAYSYDDLGNLTAKAGRAYTYGDAAHPGAVTKVGSGVRPGVEDDTLIGWGLDATDPIYTITGVVKTSTGGVVTQGVVALSGAINTAVSVSTATGSFMFRGVPAGAWSLTAYVAGQKSATASYSSLTGNVSGLTLTLTSSTATAPTPLAAVAVGPTGTPGRLNGALSFNGTSDAFAFPGSSSMSPAAFTVMAWVKPTAYPSDGTYGTIIAKTVAADHHALQDGWRIVLTDDGRVAFEMANWTYTDYWTPFQIPLNKWTFVAFHYDGQKARFVINDTYESNRIFAGGIDSNDEPVTLGASLNQNGRPADGTFFTGSIDEPRFEGRAWDTDEMTALYDSIDVSGNTYAYDAAGNCIQKQAADGTWNYSYDADGRLRRVDKDGAAVATMVYDPSGARLKKITPAGTTFYIGDLYEQRPDGSRIDHIAGIGDVVRQGSTASMFYSNSDHLGSIQQVTDSNGAIVQNVAYKPFGERYQSSGASSNHRWYTGQEEDSETGLDYYKARYYDADLGRFLSADSVAAQNAVPQSSNRYAYVENAPVERFDPSGHDWLKANIDGFNKNFVANALAVQSIDKLMGSGLLASRPDGRAVLAGQAAVAGSFGIGSAIGLEGTLGWGSLTDATASYFSAQKSGGNLLAAVAVGALRGGAEAWAFDGLDAHTNMEFAIVTKGVISGEIAAMQGGSFWTALAMEGAATVASWSVRNMLQYNIDPTPGTEIEDDPLHQYHTTIPPEGKNVVGYNSGDGKSIWAQGNTPSRFGNAIPGGKVVGEVHDYWLNTIPAIRSQPWNALAIIPAIPVSAIALVGSSYAPLVTDLSRR